MKGRRSAHATQSRDPASPRPFLRLLRAALTADVLFGTYQLLAEAEGLDLVSVTALFGAPGEGGLAEQIWYRRDERGWKATAPLARPISTVPSLPASVAREPAEESWRCGSPARPPRAPRWRRCDCAWTTT